MIDEMTSPSFQTYLNFRVVVESWQVFHIAQIQGYIVALSGPKWAETGKG